MSSFHKLSYRYYAKKYIKAAHLINSANGDDCIANVQTYEVGVTLVSLQPGSWNNGALELRKY